MPCSEILPSAAISGIIAVACLGTAGILLLISRGFAIRKLGIWGIEYELTRPIEFPGDPSLRRWPLIPLIIGICAAVSGAIQTARPAEWPTKFSDVCSADLQLSKIDDLVTVRINGVEAVRGRYKDNPSREDILPLLKDKPNRIEIIVQNDLYGGCGAKVELRLNKMTNKDFTWEKQRIENQLPGIICFSESMTLDLS